MFKTSLLAQAGAAWYERTCKTMERRGLEIKVGLFVLIAIAAAAVMIVKFGKNGRSSKDSYPIEVRFTEVGGIIHNAPVYYSGVYVGTVSDIQLDDAANRVLISLSIIKKNRIPNNARFEIRQVGFLGDKVINITPILPSSREYLKPGAVVEGIVPIDIGNLSERAGTLVLQIGGFVENLNVVIKRLNAELLDPKTLADTRTTIANAASVSQETVETMRELKEMLRANRPAVDTALANFVALSADLERAAKRVDTVVAESAPKVKSALTSADEAAANIRSVSTKLQSTADQIDLLLAKVEKGDGVLGVMVSNPKAGEEFKKMLEDLTAFSASIRKRGILGYKDEQPRKSAEPTTKEEKPSPAKGGVIFRKSATPQPAPDSPSSSPEAPKP
jgi:phospholipid/cholesterol/gamma-HCH transport system substrate-binding protein